VKFRYFHAETEKNHVEPHPCYYASYTKFELSDPTCTVSLHSKMHSLMYQLFIFESNISISYWTNN